VRASVLTSAGLSHADLARIQNHAIEKRPIELAVVRWTSLRFQARSSLDTPDRTPLIRSRKDQPSWCKASKLRFGAPWANLVAMHWCMLMRRTVCGHLDRGPCRSATMGLGIYAHSK